MDIPLETSSATPGSSTASLVKEDGSSSSSGLLKIASGEVTVSPCETQESIPLCDAEWFAAFQAATTSDGTSCQTTCSPKMVFLSPELVDLEIQISDMFCELEKADTQATPSERDVQCRQEGLSFGAQKASSGLVYESKPGQLSRGRQPDIQSKGQAKQDLSSSRIGEMSSSSRSSLAQFFSRKAESSSVLAQQATAVREEQEKLLSTIKSQQGDTKKDQQGQQQGGGRHQQENEEDSQHQEKEEELSIAHLCYRQEMRKQQPAVEEKTFRRKAQSPMALFKASAETKAVFPPIQTPQIENVFVRFMRLMARILGQAEAEAHELYLRVKERTDNVDTLTLLLSKINTEKGDIDWSKDDEMQALVDRAKQLGVTIGDTYKWSSEDKKLLKENIQMRKENMEKITQLERTDMQRHLQEVSQCHQARSNVLKLLKEVTDTFVYNMRP